MLVAAPHFRASLHTRSLLSLALRSFSISASRVRRKERDRVCALHVFACATHNLCSCIRFDVAFFSVFSSFASFRSILLFSQLRRSALLEMSFGRRERQRKSERGERIDFEIADCQLVSSQRCSRNIRSCLSLRRKTFHCHALRIRQVASSTGRRIFFSIFLCKYERKKDKFV